MNVEQMTMPRAEARRKLRAVRKQLHRRADAEYQQLEVAYRALANGKPVIVLPDAIAGAPRDDKGRPRIAIARADRVQVRLQSTPGWVFYASIGRGGSFWRSKITTGVRYPDMSFGVPSGFALVPIVPPDVRGVHALDTHYVLWEVEHWANSEIGARPDRDPLLLKHLVGDMFAVVAEWDLTDVERAVMAARARG